MNRAPQSFRASTRPIVAPTRALSTCRSASSPSSPPTPPPQAGRASPKNTAVYRTVVRTAVLGAYELSSPAEAPRYSLRSHGFKASKVRKTPESHHGSRAKLVEVDPARVTRDGYSRDPRRAIPSRRQFSTCARRQRVSDDSLGLEDSGADIEGGSWDAERGGNRLRAPRAGDWVETRRDGVPMSGIYLGRGAFSTRRFMILPMSGTLTEASNDDITFVIPGVVPSSLAESASFYNTPEVSPSTPEAREMLQRLREIEFAVEEETKLVVSRGGQDLYRLLHAPSPNSTSKKRVSSPPSSVTISAALRALRLSPSAPNSTHSVPLARQVAMHRVLLDNPAHFLVDDLAVRVTGRFDLRDPLEVARFEKIRDWTREQSGEMTSFAERAAKVREWGRSHPATAVSRDGKLELRKLPEDDSGTFVWTKDDQEIIEFLRNTLAYERVLQSQPHMAIAPSILKLVDQQSAALGFDGWGGDDEIKKQRIRQFLSEIGEVPEWENWVAHARKTGLGSWASTGAKVEGALARKKSSSSAKSNGSLGSTDYYPQDPHDSIRHDFGNITVYTIDDAGAFELDDGVSLSPAPPSSSGKATHWVHVHIADPTALLHPGHLVSRLARVRDHTEYFPEKTWSMLPDKFVEQEKMSLGSAQGGEQNVMSFGMRVEEETGEVLEQEVKVGVVRRVLRLTYAGVDKALGHVSPPPRAKVQHPVQASEAIDPVRPESRQRQIDDDVLSTDPGAVSTLRSLHNLSKKLLARRVADSALFWNFPSASVSVSPSISPSFKTSSRPTFYASSPLVTLHLPPAGEVAYVDSPATLLVSELMVAANRTAARFSVERGLHVPFRTQSAPIGTPQAIETVLKLRNLATGQASAFEVLKNPIEFAPGANTPSSGPHWPMGINDAYGYVKVTSPLRRYSDLFGHWQLKSALLSASSAPPYATPRFDLPAVLSHIEGFDVAAKARHRLSEASSTFWSLYVVSRKFELLSRLSSPTSTLSASDITPEDLEFVNLLAGGLTAIALRLPSHSAFNNLHIQPVLIPQLGVRGTLQFEKLDMASAVGEEVDVKIDEVVLNSRSKLVVSRR